MESVNLFKRPFVNKLIKMRLYVFVYVLYLALQLASFPFLNSGTTRIVSSARPIFSNCTQKNNKTTEEQQQRGPIF